MEGISRYRRVRVSAVLVGMLAAYAAGVPVAVAQVVDFNVNVTGIGADGYDVGQLGRQENEPSCKSNPLNELNILCAYNFYGYADLPEKQGDSWIGFSETRDGRTFVRRVLTGTRQNSWNGQDFAADPTMLVSDGFAAVTSIAGVRGGNSIMQIQRMLELNTETGFRHLSESGQIEIASISGSNFIDKPDARIIPHPDGGTETVTMVLEDGRTITRELPRIRILVTFAVFNSSNQNIRTYSTYSDGFGAAGTWSNPRQITQTTGLDQGLSVANIGDDVVYVVRRFGVGSEPDSILGAFSRDGGRRIGKVFEITSDVGFCPFDQVTLPDATVTQAVSFRTNDFPWVSATKHEYVLVYAERPRLADGSCSTSGSRVVVRTSRNGSSWSAPVEVSPVAGHAFQFMQSIACGDEFCQALWYDTRNESIAFETALAGVDQKHWEENPNVEDFNVVDANLGLLRFRRTADVYTNRIHINRSGSVPQPLPNAMPERVSRYIVGSDGIERQFNLMNIRAFGGNTVPFDGDYISISALGDTSGAKVNFFAAWTDWRDAKGVLVDSSFNTPSPYAVSTDSVVAAVDGLPDAEATPNDDRSPDAPVGPDEPGLPTPAVELVAKAPAEDDRFLSAFLPRAEGLYDENVNPSVCVPVDNEAVNTPFNTQTKNSEIYGAVIEDRLRLVSPTTAKNYDYCVNVDPSTGNCLAFAQIQRTFVLGINNDADVDRAFKLVIANQPGQPVQTDPSGDDQVLVDARASWRQLPFGPVFDPLTDPAPVVVENLTVPGQSFDYVTLFVVSQSTDNPVTVLAYDDSDTLVAKITVNGISEAGDLVDPGVIPQDVRIEEVHNPALIQPDWGSLQVVALNPAFRNPAFRNPAYRNPAYRNPAYRNPALRNEAFQDSSITDPTTSDAGIVYEYELREPTDLLNPSLRNPALRNEAEVDSFVDITFGVEGQTNTISAYNADFAFAGDELSDLDTQVIAWNDNEIDSLRNCGIAQISEDTVIAAVNNPSFRNLAVADIENNLEGSIHFVTGVQDVTNLTIRIFGPGEMLQDLVEIPDGCDPATAECSRLQKNLGWVVAAQAGNTADCNDPDDVAACQIIKDKTLIIRDVIPPAFEPRLEDGATFTSEATFSDPDAAAEVDLISTIPLTAFDNGTEVGVTCYVNGELAQTEMPTLVPLGDSGAQCDTDPDAQGNVGTWTGFVRVEDNEAPTISIPGGDGAELVVAPADINGAIVAYLGDGNFNGGTISASDNIFKDGYPYPALSCEPGSGTLFPIGSTAVTCTATDAGPCDTAVGERCAIDAGSPSGSWNVATASFTVTVRDVDAPVFDDLIPGEAFLPDVGPIEATAVLTPVALPAPALTDDIDANPTATPDVDPAEFPLGTSVITWTAVDFSGNESMAQQRVLVQDTTPPVVSVSFPDGSSQTTDSLGGKAVRFDLDINDIFPDASSVACETAPGEPVVSGDIFPVGDTTVTCTAADTSGNTGSGSATVSIGFLYSASGISGKSSGKTGSSFPLDWAWTDGSGTPVAVAEQTLSIEQGSCPAPGTNAQDPGNSGLRELSDGSYTYNLQAVDPTTGANLPADRPSTTYCFTVALPTGETQDIELKIRP